MFKNVHIWWNYYIFFQRSAYKKLEKALKNQRRQNNEKQEKSEKIQKHRKL